MDDTALAVGVAEQPGERVEHHRRAGVADVGAVIDRRPAHVDGDAVGIAGHELALLARHGVVEADHSPSPPPLRLVSTQSTIARPLALSNGKLRELVIHDGRSASGP